MKMKMAVVLAAILAVQSMHACIVSFLQPCGGGELTSHHYIKLTALIITSPVMLILGN